MLGTGVVKGMLTTFGHLFSKKVTVQYPEEQMQMPPWTRGRPRLIYDLDSGDLRCVACNACALACPVDVIKIESHAGPDRKKVMDRFDIDMGGCIECALCVEACPFRAIVMAPDFEMAFYDRVESLVYNMHQLRIAGTPEVDAAMEHIIGIKRGFAGQQAGPGQPARADGQQAGARAGTGAGQQPDTRPAPQATHAPSQPHAEPQPTTPSKPGAAPQIDPKELEGLSPRERAALYKQRQREAGIVPPRRAEGATEAAPAREAGAGAQEAATAEMRPAPAPRPAPGTPHSASSGEGYLGLSPEELAGLSAAERAALYKRRQREMGIGPAKKEGEG